MKQMALLYLSSLIVLGTLDGIWLYTMTDIYRRELGPMMASSIRVVPALGFYPVYALAICVLAILPSDDAVGAALRGVVLGIAAYGAYDLTNRATLEHFSIFLTVVDLTWGTFVTTATAGIVKGFLAPHFK